MLVRGGRVVTRQAVRDDCDVRIQDSSISRQHAMLRMGNRITVEDALARSSAPDELKRLLHRT